MRLGEFLATVLVMELTPGPNMAWLAALAMARGRQVGLLAVAGVAAGLAAQGALAGIGVASLVRASAALYESLRWLGVGLMLFLAWEAWRDAHRPLSVGMIAAERAPGAAFWRGALTNLINPKSALFFVAVVPGFAAGPPPGEADAAPALAAVVAPLAAIYVGVATTVHLGVVLLAARLGPWLMGSGSGSGSGGGRRRATVQRAMALLLVAAAVWLAVTTGRAG